MALMMMPWIGSGRAYAAAASTSVNVTGTYDQTSARSMLSMINTFRSGSDAWYWNEDDKTKKTLTGLGSYSYDYDLEKIAMQRAAETALTFEHTRPNGELCFTCESGTTSSYGENIAAGTSTASAAFELWQETSENYSGQGHRRNMLSSDFTSIGIAHFKYDGTDYWVQEFGYTNSGAASTAVNDSKTTVPVDVVSTALSGIKASPASVSMTYGESRDLPVVSATVNFSKGWPSTERTVTLNAAWTAADSSIISISGGSLVSQKSGSTTITATASGGTGVEAAVTVRPISLAGASVTLENTSYTYSGNANRPAVSSVVLNGRTLTENTDYTVSYSSNINAGAASAVISGKGNYTGTISKSFRINARNISGASLSGLSDKTFTGSAQTQAAAVAYGSTVLVKDRDYSLSYSANTNAGTAYVTILGKGNYQGSLSGTFIIKARDISEAAAGSIPSQMFTGSAVTPDISLRYNNRSLVKGIDYTVSFSDNMARGKATARIIGKGNYTGSLSRTFLIKSRQSITGLASQTDRTADGSAFDLGAAASTKLSYFSSDTRVISIDADGHAVITGPGRAVISVNAAESDSYLSASARTTVTVYPAKIASLKLKKARKKFTASWAKETDVSGYQLVYAANKKFSRSKKTVLIRKADTGKTVIRKLKSKKTYYVKIRAYKKTGSQTLYGAYSKTVKIKVK